MNDLVEFLRARLDEDEAAAEAASPGPWYLNAEHDEVLAVDDVTVAEAFALSNRQLRATAEHIARHDPARVLAEVDAKRRIIARWEQAREEARNPVSSDHFVRTTIARGELGDVLLDLALPYASHPDYDHAWRPA